MWWSGDGEMVLSRSPCLLRSVVARLYRSLALLRTLALNLLRCNGFRSIRAGLMAVAHDISRMLDWVGIGPTATGSIDVQSALDAAGVVQNPKIVL